MATSTAAMPRLSFATEPAKYRHWKLTFDGAIATLAMDVQEDAGLSPDYKLKLNSYDLGVDIELADAIQRIRFEHPEVHAVVITSLKERIFCAGANIFMLRGSSHAWKVNFCKYTNETRLAIEDASAHSGIRFIAAVNGICAGGGYELALACDEILLVDDGNSAVSLPETPLLAVLPGTGGLTRIVDKRKVRRDLADVFSTLEEGVRGKRAVEWRLVDEVVPKSAWEQSVRERALELAAKSDRPVAKNLEGVKLDRLAREFSPSGVTYRHVHIGVDRERRMVELTVRGPTTAPPPDGEAAVREGSAFWPHAMARELDDAILHLRFNEPELGLIVLRTAGDVLRTMEYDALLESARDHWFIREVVQYIKRVLKRLDLTSRSIIALIEPGSCFAGTLAELAFAADRSAMLEGTFKGESQQPALLTLSSLNFGAYPMSNGLSRLETRFLGEPASVDRARKQAGVSLDAGTALGLGLVTV